jgi:3-methyl-2-oxobutanoate hydroxymethyltransferase
MSSHREANVRRITAPDIFQRKGAEPLVALTAYTAPIAALIDEACDLILVGDSTGMVAHGFTSTVPVTLDMMILHGQAVMRGARKAMVVVDLPFGSYEANQDAAYGAAVRIMKETGAQGVKVESGPTIPATIRFLVDRGIPVMGHVGLRPQAVNLDGGFKAKGRTASERQTVLAEAHAVSEAGAFAIVVEGVAESLARDITNGVRAPTFGIGASAGCDGQILVTDDMLGMFDWTPKFVRRYADLAAEITRAVGAYAEDVRARRFPGPAETYFNGSGQPSASPLKIRPREGA